MFKNIPFFCLINNKMVQNWLTLIVKTHICSQPKKEDKIKFNTSNCIYPLIKTSYEDSYYDAIEGCSMKCNTAYFSDRDHVDVHNFVSVLLGMSLICTLFALVSVWIKMVFIKFALIKSVSEFHLFADILFYFYSFYIFKQAELSI